MLIDLHRAFSPESMGEHVCALCRRDFVVGSVVAEATTDGGQEIGWVCPDCVGYFGRANPEEFPTIEEFEEFVRRYPEPIWATGEEAERAEEEGTYGAAVAASWLWRAPG